MSLAWTLDLMLVPLVGFDGACNRIGMGGGFYDRTLAYLRRRRHWRRPRLIGIAHECQRVDRIDPRPWDIPLDAVVTEQGVYRRTNAADPVAART
jgi:5-formyltetrahydrofolate cyclo-ligase